MACCATLMMEAMCFSETSGSPNYGVTTQNVVLFIVTAVRTSNPKALNRRHVELSAFNW
jgi:hypothetical protein